MKQIRLTSKPVESQTKKHPLVSIMTPTYNHEGVIGACIESVLVQTYSHWEMVVINDGSTDSTGKIVAQYSQQDPRIRLLQQKNKGVYRLAETYNKALSNARGKYIAVLEGDDVWMPHKLMRQVAALETHPDCVMAWGKAEAANRDLSHVYQQVPHENPDQVKYYANVPLGNILNLLLFNNTIPALTVLIRREALERIHGFHQTAGIPLVDIPTWYALSQTGAFFYDPLVMGMWRVTGGQTSKKYSVGIMQKRADLAVQCFRNLPEAIRKNLTVTEKALAEHYDSELQIAFARSGRYKLLRRDFTGARQDYLRAIFYKGLKNTLWRLRAIIGYLFSLMHRDVEDFAGILGRQTYSK